MIDVKRTILETIKSKIFKMRFVGEYDPTIFKHILFLIVLDDLYDWSDYLDERLAVQKKLQDLRTQFILDHGEFIVLYFKQNGYYINVNTPQTNDTWKRVWDEQDVIEIKNAQPIISGGTTTHFTPDPTCPISVTYYTREDLAGGPPTLNIDNLTTCEKMNIYINRETGEMFFLNPENCLWQPVTGEFAKKISWTNIEGRPDIYSGIEHSIDGDNSVLNVTLNKATFEDGHWNYGSQSSDITVTDSNPDPELNTDLNDIL